MNDISIILPARNEGESLKKLVPEIRKKYPAAQIIVVDDGSDDDTAAVAKEGGADTVISHTYSMGNGAAIKTGTRHAKGDVLVFMDADGQHRPEDVQLLLDKINENYDMAVGARSSDSQASLGRLCANSFYNWFASLIVGQKISDLTSGMRAVRKSRFRQFLYLFPNGFSYPTTSTMAFFRSGYPVAYVPVNVMNRIGKSHLRPLRDGLRFLLIIFKVGTLYSPLKIFVPASLMFFITGVCYYAYTYITMSRFTNMSALLFISSILVFLIGLVSEQITSLMYSKIDEEGDYSKHD